MYSVYFNLIFQICSIYHMYYIYIYTCTCVSIWNVIVIVLYIQHVSVCLCKRSCRTYSHLPYSRVFIVPSDVFFLLWLIAELHNPGLFRSVLNVWPFLWTSHLISNSPQDNISQFIHNPKFQLVRGFNMFQLFQFFSTIHKGFFVETSIPLSEKFSGISPLLRKKTWWYTTSLSCLTCRSCRSRSTHWRLLSTWAISIGISTKKHAITHWIWIRWSEFVVYHGFQIGTHFFLTQRMRFDKRSQSARVRT